MKKIFLFLFAMTAMLYVKAQTNVVFQVDITKYLAGGATVAGAGIRIAGTFHTDGATVGGIPMTDWTPADTTGKLVNTSGNIWSTVITFPADTLAKGTDTLFFKFINGTWGAGFNEGNPNTDDTLVQEGCAKIATANDGGNHILLLNSSIGSDYKWCYDHCVQCDGTPALVTTGIPTVKNISYFSLSPNPAVNKQSTLMYSISQYSAVNVSLYNVLGQAVKTFVNTNRPSGVYNQTIDLSGLNTGVYFIQLTSGNQTVTRKITL